MYVNKTYSAHFYLKINPEHPLNISGVKSEDEIYEIARELIKTAIFSRAYYRIAWKETKRSKWLQEEYVFNQGRLQNESQLGNNENS
jgi:hypothetical protein